jgi:hypothetical protein
MQQALQSALANMKTALRQLDEADAEADIGAHLDLAICRLQALIAQSGSDVVASSPK